MQVFADIVKMQSHISSLKSEGKKIGFAPTMGALHLGHISLIQQIQDRNMVSVCSIFVNPTQFNQQSDLDKYPRVLREDLTLLEQHDCDIVFIPTVDAVYPQDLDTRVEIDREGLDMTMEGHFRPGHFDGMLQVVNRLINIVLPEAIFMGQKDYQQFALVQHMGHKLHPGLDVVMCPIIREGSGLAMSSRNRRLTEEWRERAPMLSQTLKEAKSRIEIDPVQEIQDRAFAKMRSAGFKPEYFEIADGVTLKTVEDAADHEIIVACLAAWAGEIRLIDNMILKDSTL